MKIRFQIGALLFLQFVALAEPVPLQLLQGHRPEGISHLKPVGRLEGTREIKLAIGLPLRDQKGLTNLLQSIYDPASPNYHHFLTPAQFADSFGPTAKDYETIKAFAVANGLKVSATHPNRVLLDITGTVLNIEKAFHLTLRTYPHPRENRVFYAPDVEPSLNLDTPVLHIAGLDNYVRPHPLLFVKSPLAGFTGYASGGGSGPSGAYLGNDFRTAYFPGLTLDGAGQSLGLLEFDGYYTNDIATYAGVAGISAVPLTNVYLDGFDGTPGENNTEVALDIDMANCMAPGMSSVLVYEGETGDDLLNRMATDGLANQLSSSWSFPIDAATEQIFQQFAAQGQSYFNASGDSDAWVGAISPPCDDPNITIVGGTTLTTSPGGAWESETVWNWDIEFGPSYNGIGSSGGISTIYTIPNWQAGVSMTANQGSIHYRNVPDVALTADNIFVVADNGQGFIVAGTSCATPLWTAVVALANEQAAAQNRPKVGFINPAIYALGLSPYYTNCFHDITTGNNTWSSSPQLFRAVAGYDLCSGWGTPMGSNLVNMLAPADVLQISPLGSWASIGGVGGPAQPASQSYTLTNTGSTNLSWAAAATVPWLSLSPQSGALTPGGAAAIVEVSLNSAANHLSVGTYSATLWFTNLSDGIAQCCAVSLQIIAPPVIAAQPASLSVVGGATAIFNASAAGGLPLVCQWQYNGVSIPIGGRFSVSQTTANAAMTNYGSVVSTLTISNVAITDGGNYSFAASNAAGMVVSSNAVLAVARSGPVIIEQPASQTALVGGMAQFSVQADGTAPFTYQWQQNKINLTDGGAVSGSLTPTLTINGVSSASIGTYTVLVSNTVGAANSAGATLSVQVAVPGPPLVQNGGFETGDFSFWDEAGNFINSSVSTNASAVYSGAYGALLGPPDSLGYLSQILPTSAGQVYLLSLWLDSLDGLGPNEFLAAWNGTVLLDQTNLGAIGWTNLQFYVTATSTTSMVTFGFRDDVTSLGLDAIQVIPLASADGPPIIATQPSNQVGVQGGTASFSVLSSGRLPLFYQWQFDGTNLPQATNATLSLTNLTSSQAGGYDVLVSNALGGTTSASALLTVLPGSMQSITFDDLPDILAPVPEGYDYLIWSNFYYLNGFMLAPSGYSAGVVSIPKVAYNGDGTPAAISASAPFALLSAYLTAAWNSQMQLEVQGYNGPALIYDHTYNLSATAPTLISFNYVGVTSVRFISSDGVPDAGYDGSGTQFVMDNVTVVPATPPLSTTVLHSFDGFDGSLAAGTLTLGADGNFYGTTEYGGTNGYGNVFKMATNGNLTPLLSFNDTNGAYPAAALVQGTDGKFYGSTRSGGANGSGTLFSITTNAVLTTLYSFVGVNNNAVSATWVEGRDGNFYGTTPIGGTSGGGTVFKMTTNGVFSTLASLPGVNNSVFGNTLVQGDDGNFYGTTPEGGTNGDGAVFRLTSNGIVSILASFDNNVTGYFPVGLLQGSDGNFYGITYAGGTNYAGTVFRITTNGTLSTFASFDYGLTGAYPTAGFIQGRDGNFYGTADYGGIYDNGTVFSLLTNGTLTSLYSFASDFGINPNTGVVEGADAGFYGTTLYGGLRFNGAVESGDGIIFRLGAAQTGASPSIIAQPASQIAPVNGTAVLSVSAAGAVPLGYSWQLDGAPIAGATQSSYSVNNIQWVHPVSQFNCVISNAYGSVTSSMAALTVFNASGPLFSFHGPDGGYSTTALVQGADGNFYGTTAYGGTNGDGTVFLMTTNGLLSTLASFDQSADGYIYPEAGLTWGGDGNLYGTTYYGGTHDLGTVFRMTTNGAITTLLSFGNSDGGFPGALILGADGNFYGSTFIGGTYGGGTVYRLTTNGTLTTLASLVGGYPYAGLGLGVDGSIYGTTYEGGSNGYGSIFRITPNSPLSTLFSFDNTHGANPCGGLVQGTDGNFYGVTYAGGANGFGTIFNLTTNGTLTTLLSFNSTNGAYPYGGLVQGADGNFYGTTTQDGPAGYGTVFSMTAGGTLTTLFSFNGFNGSYPSAALIQGLDGSFYGSTSFGGLGFDGVYWRGNGTVFRLVGAFTKGAPLILAQPVSQNVVVGANVTFSVSVAGSPPFTYQWQLDGVNLTNTSQLTGSQSNVLTLASVTMNEAGTYKVMVTNAYGSANAFATLTVQADSVLAWTNPAPIPYGALLTSNQLNATANVPGSFDYNPTNGADLNTGSNILSVIFIPTNTNYSSVTDSVSLVVLPAPLSVTASNSIRPYGQTNPVFGGSLIGVTNGDDIKATYTCSAQTNSPAGTYAIVPTLVDPDNRQTNYAITIVNGTLTITGAPILTWTNPAPITYGTVLGSNQLDATATVPGHFSYSPTSGSILNPGSNLLSVIFSPNDTVDYSSVTDTVYLVVLNVLVSNSVLPTYEPFTEYAGNVATNTAGTQTNSIDLCTAGLIAPAGQPWLCQSFSGSVGTGLAGLDIQVSNDEASVFTSNNLSSLLPTNFPGYPAFGNAITTIVINPAQPLVAAGTNPPAASPNIVGNSAVLQFAQDFSRPASGTKTLFVSYLFDDAQQGQTANDNNGRYLCFVASSNVVEGRNSGGFHTNWQAMYNTFETNAGPRYFSHAVRYPNTLDVGPADSANASLPSPLSTLSTPFGMACFVVGEFVFVSTNASLAGVPDTNVLWLNPPLSAFGGPTPATNRFSAFPMLVTMTDIGGLVLLDRPGAGQFGGVGTNYMANLILGNTWSFVTGGPEFTSQPANSFGSNVTLSAAAVAAGQTVTYQWQHVAGGITNNLTNGLINPGGAATVNIVTHANITTLSLSNISTADATGYYQVVATASSTKFSLSSSMASVSVLLPPPPIIHFVYPPVINELAGDHVAYLASATGTGNIFYQWYHSNKILPGQTSPTLALTNIQAASSGQYEVTVVDGSGIYVTNEVTLNVSSTPWPLYPNNLVVVRVGDGIQTLSGAAGNTIYLDQYTTTGVYVSSLMVPDESVGSPYGAGSSASVFGSPALLLPGSGNDCANSGLLTLSANQQFLNFAAYCANYPFGGGDVTEGGASYSRGLAAIDGFGRYSLAYTNAGLYRGGNHSIRSAVTLDETNFWTAGQSGSGGGVKYINTQNTIYNDGFGIPSISTSSETGTFTVQIFETNLIYSDVSASNGSGLYICGGTPEPAANGFATSTLLLNEGGQPNDFAISPDGRTIYIADRGTFSNVTSQAGGIQRWDTNSAGGGYSFTYTLPVYETSGAQGLAVYFPSNITQWGSNVLGAALFATSPSNVLSAVIDNGPNSTASILLNTSPFNEQLHGVRFAPPVVIQTAPIITWTNPASIPFGTPLSSNQLNASANLPGSFAYTPPIGSVLNAGTNTLSVVFTPMDTFHYISVTDTVSLVVTGPARPIIQTAKQSGSSFTFTWSAITNQMYEIQSTTNLTLTNWAALGSPIIATNSTMIISEPISAHAPQYYRVVLLR